MAEGTVQVLSTSWDTCIERAASGVYCDVVACRQPGDLRMTGPSAILLKLHGCAEIQVSIRVANEEIIEPPWWASHQAGAAIERWSVMHSSDLPRKKVQFSKSDRQSNLLPQAVPILVLAQGWSRCPEIE